MNQDVIFRKGAGLLLYKIWIWSFIIKPALGTNVKVLFRQAIIIQEAKPAGVETRIRQQFAVPWPDGMSDICITISKKETRVIRSEGVECFKAWTAAIPLKSSFIRSREAKNNEWVFYKHGDHYLRFLIFSLAQLVCWGISCCRQINHVWTKAFHCTRYERNSEHRKRVFKESCITQAA